MSSFGSLTHNEPMSNRTKHPALRWAAPLLAVAITAGVPLTIAASASAEPTLPARTAQELLVDLQGLKPQALSGEITQVANLGLPELPGMASPTVSDASIGSLLTLASGTHNWRVWTDGAKAQRVALVQGSNESDVIRNGDDVWIWSSQASTAEHYSLAGDKTQATPPASPTKTPEEIAADVLKAIDPTTAVTTSRTSYVAGRSAYELVLTPKQTGTKVGSVHLSLDATTSVPLRVQVFAHDGTNAIDVGFTAVTFAQPDAGIFTFTPPPGVTVTDHTGEVCTDRTECQSSGPKPEATAPKVIGTGWTTVVVAESPLSSSSSKSDSSASALLDQLPVVSGTWGRGRLLDSSLVSVVLTDDGRVAAGAVTPDALYTSLATK